ncbi:MAG: hypothetical protein ACRYFX_09470 [Janthinobacterium lividum]
MSLQVFTSQKPKEFYPDEDYEQGGDPDFEQGADPDFDDTTQASGAPGADPDYGDDFADGDAEESSQEYYKRSQK